MRILVNEIGDWKINFGLIITLFFFSIRVFCIYNRLQNSLLNSTVYTLFHLPHFIKVLFILIHIVARWFAVIIHNNYLNQKFILILLSILIIKHCYWNFTFFMHKNFFMRGNHLVILIIICFYFKSYLLVTHVYDF